MLILAIALLVILGIALLITEFFVLPGTIIPGIAGILLIFFGIILTWKVYGGFSGGIAFLASLIIFIFLFGIALNSKTWKKVSLTSEIQSKVNTFENNKIQPGDKGITISRLAPMGKVSVNDIIVEAKSTGEYIAEKTAIEVVKVNESNIIVKSLNI